MNDFSQKFNGTLAEAYHNALLMEETKRKYSKASFSFRDRNAIAYLLRYEKGRTVSELAEYLKISRPSATSLVKKLEKHGLVARHSDPVNDRNTVVTVTRKGRMFSAYQRQYREEMAEAAYQTRDRGNIGIAFTYNEPLVGYEFVRDTARIVHEAGMVNALVTNGTAEISVLEELAPYIDAMNIDLKGFTDRYYEDVLGGSRQMVMRFIEEAVKVCHVELTTLIVPCENDSEDEMREMAKWIAGLDARANGASEGAEIPLHISRFFPQFHMTDRPATDVGLVYRLAETAREQLKYVYTGNC